MPLTIDRAAETAEPASRCRITAAEVAALLAVAAATAFALAHSWNRWLEPIIDSGRDLYVPGAILHGAKLYSDLLYFYPPTTPYLLALITSVIGRSLAAYTAIGLASAITAAAVAYGIARQASGWTSAVSITLLFVSLNLAGATTWGANWIFPYAYTATFAMTSLLIAVLFLYRFLFVTRASSTGWLAMLFALLSATMKIEYAAAVAALLAVSLVVYRLPLRYAAGMVLAGIAALILLSIYFHDPRPGHDWLRDNVLASSLLSGTTSRFFYGSVSGTDRWASNLRSSLIGLLEISAMAGTIAMIDRMRVRSRAATAALAIVLGALFYFGAGERFFMAWTLIMIALVPFALREWRSSPLLLLLTVSLATAIRIIFFLGPWWYGFVLIIPTYLLIAYVLFHYLPRMKIYSEGAAKLWVLFFALLAINGLARALPAWAAKSEPVNSRMGTYYDYPYRAVPIEQFLRWMENRPAGETLVVMPEGLTLNYLSGHPTNLSYQTFTPIEIADPEIEKRIVDELRQRRPDLVALVTRDVREFGYRGFGIDYGRPVIEFLRREYRPVGTASSPRFRILVLQRNGG
ncbi:MAG: hypothetical protein WBX15_06185 [Thermoanaerobaculia bacterium]